MSITRTAVACVLACGLLAITAATAAAAPSPEERYLNSYGSPPAADVSTASAQAQEQYYSSYGTPASHQQPSGETPWLPIALVSARDRRGRRRGRRHPPPSPPPRRAKRARLAVRHRRRPRTTTATSS